jgi:hypothetical protein
MPGYPKPDGYVGSGADGDIMRTGSGGRLSNNIEDPSANWTTADERNEQHLDSLSGTDPSN